MELIPVLEFLDDKEHITDSIFVTKLPRHRLDADTKQKVLTYLNNKDFAQWWSDSITFENPFTGKQSRITGYTFNDGKYKWNCHLPVYVRNHDVKLPDDFIERVLKYSTSKENIETIREWDLPEIDSTMILTLDGLIPIEEFKHSASYGK